MTASTRTGEILSSVVLNWFYIHSEDTDNNLLLSLFVNAE